MYRPPPATHPPRTRNAGVDYYQIFVVYFTFPIALVAYVYFSYRVVLVLMHRRKLAQTPEGADPELTDTQLTDAELIQLQSHFIKTVLVLLFLGYPAIASKMLSVLNCTSVHGVYYLQDDLRIECETPKHRLYQAVGCIGILLYLVRGGRLGVGTTAGSEVWSWVRAVDA
jgi:hypothetical protein